MIKRLLRSVFRLLCLLVAGVVGLWFFFSLKWSYAEMSRAEVVFGVLYLAALVPLCWGIGRLKH